MNHMKDGTIVDNLQGSEERILDVTRAMRVRNVRRYFEKKKAKFMTDMMDRLDDALNEAGTAFKELNDEPE